MLLTRKNVTQPIGDLDADTASYGAPVPIHKGTTEVIAQTDWIKGGLIDVNVKKTKILFGLGGSYTTNSYFATFGCTIGEGPRRLRRIWLNDTLVADFSAEPLVAGDGVGGAYDWLSFDFQPGEDDQAPTPTEVFNLTAVEVPAYRGTCRIVFADLPLKDFGDQIPTVKVETTDAGEYYEEEIDWDGNIDNFVSNATSTGFAVDANGDIYTNSQYTLTKLSGRDLSIIWQRDVEGISDSYADSQTVLMNSAKDTPPMLFENQGVLIVPARARLRSYYVFAMSNGAFLGARENTYQGTYLNAFSINATTCVGLYQDGRLTYETLLLVDGLPATGSTINLTSLIGAPFDSARSESVSLCPGGTAILTSTSLASSNNGDLLWMLAGNILLWGPIDLAAYVNANAPANPNCIVYSALAGGLIVAIEGGQLLLVDVTDGSILKTIDTDLAYQVIGLGNPWQVSALKRLETHADTTIWLKNRVDETHSEWIEIDLAAFAIVSRITDTDVNTGDVGYRVSGGGIWSNTLNGLITDAQTVYFDRAARTSTTLGALMTDWAGRANLPSDYLDLDEATQPINGYALYDNAKTALATISDVVGADIYEEQGVIKARPRDGYAAVQSISADDLGAGVGKDTGRDRERSIGNERLLPRRIELGYRDIEADNEIGVGFAQRPAAAVETRSIAKIDSKMFYTADRAATAAWRLLDQAYRERDRIEFDLPFSKYPLLSPADTVTFPDGDDLINVKLERIAGAHARRYEGVISDPTGFTAIITGSSPTLPGGISFEPVSGSTPIAIDASLPSDDVTVHAGYVFGVAANSETAPWPGATRFQSNDAGVLYNLIGAEDTRMVQYSALSELGDVSSPWLVDRANTITIRSDETYTDATLAGLYANPLLNLLYVAAGDDWELVQYADATDNADGTWTFSTLLRGMRGTEFLTGEHRAGDPVIPYNAETFDRYGSASDYGVDLYIAALSLNQPEETLGETNFTHNARGLRAYAPAYFEHEVAAGSPQDITFNWMARVRTGGSDLNNETPALTDENNYRIRVYSGATLKRTITVTGAQTTTYSAANYATDFPGGGTVTAKVSQQNTTTGYGVETTISFTGP